MANYNISLSDYSGNTTVGTFVAYGVPTMPHDMTVTKEGFFGLTQNGGNEYECLFRFGDIAHYRHRTPVSLLWYDPNFGRRNIPIDGVIRLDDIAGKLGQTSGPYNLEFRPMYWVGDVFQAGTILEFKDASSIEAPYSSLKNDGDGLTQYLKFNSNGVDYNFMRWKYDSTGDVLTLYYGATRVAEYSYGDETFVWMSDAYRTLQILDQPSASHLEEDVQYADEIPFTNYILMNSVNKSSYNSLTIMSNDGSSILYEEPKLYPDNYKGYPPIIVTADGIINSKTNEYIYRYAGDKLFLGLAFVSSSSEPDLAVGDDYEMPGSSTFYIIEGEPQHYIISAQTLQSIASAIRSKTGKTDPIAVDDFASEIKSIDIITDAQWKEFLEYLENGEDQYV